MTAWLTPAILLRTASCLTLLFEDHFVRGLDLESLLDGGGEVSVLVRELALRIRELTLQPRQLAMQ